MATTLSSTSGSNLRALAVRCADLVLLAAFLAGIAVVLALTRWNVPPGTIDTMEMRPAATPPALTLSGLPRIVPKFYHFLEENFGLRMWAIRLRTEAWLWCLHSYPSPAPAFSTNVYVGRDHWLFYAGNRIPADLLHADPLSPTTLAAWSRGIAERREWLAKRGIRYLFVLTPDKRTINPDKLPPFYQLPRPGLTRRQQLDRQLAGEPGYLDLTNALRAERSQGQIYYRFDTHWNRLGAYDGYAAAMSALGLTALPRNLGRPEARADHDGDLGRMIGLKLLDRDNAPVATCPRPAPANEAAAVAGLQGADPLYAQAPTVCPGAPGRLLMFHDSFGSMWQPYLSSQFGFAGYAWTEPTFSQFKAVVKAVHPTVVIEQRVERFLILPLR
jgi:hypothetical protein